jgi:hypothetical protein
MYYKRICINKRILHIYEWILHIYKRFMFRCVQDIDRFCARAASQQLENLKLSAKSIIRDPEYQQDAIDERRNKTLVYFHMVSCFYRICIEKSGRCS